jgi:mono/diheme cytochrome c family protein
VPLYVPPAAADFSLQTQVKADIADAALYNDPKQLLRLTMHRIVFGLLSLVFASALAQPASAADARKGETLAKRWCATCHVVASDQQRGTTQAPPFSAIARRPGLNETSLAYFLLTPHPRMPDMNLSRGEAADLAAYINSQK